MLFQKQRPTNKYSSSSKPAKRKRHRLLRQSEECRVTGAETKRRRHRREAVSRRPNELRAHEESGNVPARRVRVVTATIAFGMGINKPNVRSWCTTISRKIWRAIIRRPGAPAATGCRVNACCCSAQAMWPSRLHFIDEKSEPEARIARAQLRQMVHYAESRECRRATLLGYFGETHTQPSCEGCDNCLTPRETFDGTIPAQKFLSCVHRIHAKSGFGFGVNHIVDVLRGAETEAIRQRGHNELSTYGMAAN